MSPSFVASDRLQLPDTFGAALRLLRKRAHLTQDDLGLAVGYSREQVARLENGSRLPDLAVVAALFAPALFLPGEEKLLAQFLALAGQRRKTPAVATAKSGTSARSLPVPAESPAARLPAALWPLVGRQRDLDEVLARLQRARLVTIVGAPGIGKTRLALEAAQFAQAQFRDGAVFVSLAELSQAEDIPYAALRVLEVTPAPQQTALEALRAYLAPRQLLLVLDNCEHLPEAAGLFGDWLAQTPGLKLLCTSRIGLDLYGEHEWPLSPLGVPDLAGPPDLQSWGQTPAMQLLVQRAQAVEPEFALQTEDLLPLASICVALDGLPLALELAAVRLRELSPAALVQQLLLRRGHAQLSSTWLQQTKRNIAERHRTLQAAIDWSVCLLPPALQQAFCRLGTFAGGCELAAAEALTGLTEPALELLQHASLLRLEHERLTLLETMRAYAAERLVQAGEWEAARQAHLVYYTDFAAQVFDGVQGETQDVWMRRALAEHENLLAALRWALNQNQGTLAQRLSGSLWWFWYRRGLFELGRAQLSAAIELESNDLAAQARALNGLASFCLAQEDFSAALAYHQQGLGLRQRLEDGPGVATSLHNLGLTAFMMGDFAEAMAYLQQSLAADPDADPLQAWAHLGLLAQELQDLPQARRWLEMAYQRALITGEGWLLAFVSNLLADVLREQGDLAAAAPLAEQSRQMFADLEDAFYLPDAEMTLAQLAFDGRDFVTAEVLCKRVLEQYEQRADPAAMAGALLLQAELALQAGDRAQAAVLLERARRLRVTARRAVSPREQASFERFQRSLD